MVGYGAGLVPPQTLSEAAPAPAAEPELVEERDSVEGIPEKDDKFHYMRAFDFCWPAYRSSDAIVEHEGFTLSYNERYEQPYWVAYKLTKAHLENTLMVESGVYRSDPLVRTGSASPEDYVDMVYVKGHLAPPEDFLWSHKAHSASFYMSTICPQNDDFQKNLWFVLEEKIRQWALAYDSVSVVSGAYIRGSGGRRINEKMVLPTHFYKVILSVQRNELRGVAFWMPHRAVHQKKSWRNFAVSIDRIEAWTGLDFFPTLPKQVAIEAEKEYDPSFWP